MTRIGRILLVAAMAASVPLAAAQAFGGMWLQRSYYNDEYYTTQVGYSSINCDGSSDSWGQVTPWVIEDSGFC